VRRLTGYVASVAIAWKRLREGLHAAGARSTRMRARACMIMIACVHHTCTHACVHVCMHTTVEACRGRCGLRLQRAHSTPVVLHVVVLYVVGHLSCCMLSWCTLSATCPVYSTQRGRAPPADSTRVTSSEFFLRLWTCVPRPSRAYTAHRYPRKYPEYTAANAQCALQVAERRQNLVRATVRAQRCAFG
jgi:hypothetical protein